MASPAMIEELEVEDCRGLLAGSTFGRLAVVVDGQPLIFPVNYHFEDDTILFVTAEGTKLAAADFARVAFEVDAVSADGHSGWSVVVQGHAYEITTALDQRAKRLRTLGVDSALDHDESRTVEIQIREISGRRVSPRP